VRFNDKFPLDKGRAQVSRPIFHVPNRSNFVFVDKLKIGKGSDASNAHDEEPGEDEVEFSDDEQEAAYKRMMKERFFTSFDFSRLVADELVCVRRSGSRTSSRAATPSVPTRRDYDNPDDIFRGSNNPYDEYGAYEMNYGAGPSRPPPIPYDDPYSDSFTSIPTDGDADSDMTSVTSRDGGGGSSLHAYNRNLGPDPRHRNTRGRGRGGSRNRQSERGRRGRGRGGPQPSHKSQAFPQQSGARDYSGSTSPSTSHPSYSHPPGYGSGGEWNYSVPLMAQQQPVFGFGLQSGFPGVQPHINPRFANQLGFGFPQIPQSPEISPGVGLPSSSGQHDLVDSNVQGASFHHWGEGGSG
jgi:H/ACA ribonucleoprotein complex non-core subunit NAF1